MSGMPWDYNDRIMKPLAAAFLLSFLAVGAFAQSVGGAPEAEYGRVSGGEIHLMAKHDQPFSGSLFLIGSGGRGKGYGATLGATIVPDKVWFFGSVQQSVSRGIDAKLTGLGDRQNLVASYAASKPSQPAAIDSTLGTFGTSLSSSFLSLHYTGVVSSNMFVTASFSELRRSN